MNNISIGKVVNAVGLKGEVKVFHYTDYKERFSEFNSILIENDEYKIEKVRFVKDLVILKLAGIESREAAEDCKGKDLFIEEKDLRVLPEDTYYIKDLIGLSVVDENEEPLGILSNVVEGSAQDLYEIEMENKKKFLIPAVKEFILNIDMEKRIMKVNLLEGIMDL